VLFGVASEKIVVDFCMYAGKNVAKVCVFESRTIGALIK
jgi:hypothetical protein